MEREGMVVENMREEVISEERNLEGYMDQRQRGRFLKRLRAIGRDTEGAGVIEVVLILVVLIALVILFKEQIMDLAKLIFGDMFTKAQSVF